MSKKTGPSDEIPPMKNGRFHVSPCEASRLNGPLVMVGASARRWTSALRMPETNGEATLLMFAKVKV